MRLKLVLIVSILVALLGAGGSLGIVLGFYSSLSPLRSPDLLVLGSFFLPLGLTAWGAIFVYRHTARRRKLQATMTALLSLILILGAFAGTVLLTSRSTRVRPEPTRTPRNSG
jgi:hypothetical protein